MKSVFLLLTITALAAGNQSLRANFLECDACHLVFNHLHSWYDDAEPLLGLIDNVLDVFCKDILHMAMPVCKGAIKEMSVPVMASLGNKWLDTDYVCYNIGMCSSPSFKAENFTEWSQNILADKPNAPLPIYNSTETFNVAHISDLHIDFDYVEGTNAYCDEQLCCHEANGPANSTETAAGYWGAYNNCDIPPRTLRAALEDMKNREFDFIVWTGDNPPHEIWNQS